MVYFDRCILSGIFCPGTFCRVYFVLVYFVRVSFILEPRGGRSKGVRYNPENCEDEEATLPKSLKTVYCLSPTAVQTGFPMQRADHPVALSLSNPQITESIDCM